MERVASQFWSRIQIRETIFYQIKTSGRFWEFWVYQAIEKIVWWFCFIFQFSEISKQKYRFLRIKIRRGFQSKSHRSSYTIYNKFVPLHLTQSCPGRHKRNDVILLSSTRLHQPAPECRVPSSSSSSATRVIWFMSQWEWWIAIRCKLCVCIFFFFSQIYRKWRILWRILSQTRQKGRFPPFSSSQRRGTSCLFSRSSAALVRCCVCSGTLLRCLCHRGEQIRARKQRVVRTNACLHIVGAREEGEKNLILWDLFHILAAVLIGNWFMVIKCENYQNGEGRVCEDDANVASSRKFKNPEGEGAKVCERL